MVKRRAGEWVVVRVVGGLWVREKKRRRTLRLACREERGVDIIGFAEVEGGKMGFFGWFVRVPMCIFEITPVP